MCLRNYIKSSINFNTNCRKISDTHDSPSIKRVSRWWGKKQEPRRGCFHVIEISQVQQPRRQQQHVVPVPSGPTRHSQLIDHLHLRFPRIISPNPRTRDRDRSTCPILLVSHRRIVEITNLVEVIETCQFYLSSITTVTIVQPLETQLLC